MKSPGVVKTVPRCKKVASVEWDQFSSTLKMGYEQNTQPLSARGNKWD